MKLQRILAASAVAATIPFSFNDASAARGSSPAARIEALCREEGTAQQCSCYSERTAARLPNGGMSVLADLLAIEVHYSRLKEKAYRDYAAAHPNETAVGMHMEEFAVGLTANVAEGQEEDALASRVGRDRYQAAYQADTDVWESCNVGRGNASPSPDTPLRPAPLTDSQKMMQYADGVEREPMSIHYVIPGMQAGDDVSIGPVPIHDGPGADSRVIGYVLDPYNADARIAEINGDFLRVVFSTKPGTTHYPSGWVRKDFVRLDVQR